MWSDKASQNAHRHLDLESSLLPSVLGYHNPYPQPEVVYSYRLQVDWQFRKVGNPGTIENGVAPKD
jgi:hypothetical protein